MSIDRKETRAGLIAVGSIMMAAGVAAAASERMGVVPMPGASGNAHQTCDTVCTDPHAVELREKADAIIAAGVYNSLTQEQKRIISAHELGLANPDGVALPPVLPALTGTDYDLASHIVTQDTWNTFTREQQNILLACIERGQAGMPSVAFCFAPGTDPALVMAIDQALFGFNPLAFQQTSRWSNTATDGNTGGQGDGITLTYSFPADGVNIPNLNIGLGSGPNVFNAWMNGIYGNTATWQQIFADMFARWGELIGVEYQFVTYDDGASFNNNSGQLNVRADVRIGAFDFANDGNGGVLAYNNFPNDGDMVFDGFDTFYNNTGSNSLRLRNVAWHEHGHGLGMLHVCPAVGEKLMEPFISTAYVGPQIDDILNGQRHYGDNLEPNNSFATATDAGDGTQPAVFSVISIDDNNDTDVFEITVAEPRQLIVGIDLTLPANIIPGSSAGVPEPYLDASQTQSCGGGSTFFDPATVHDLTFSVIREADNAIIAVINDSPAGGNEFAEIILDTPGTYFVTVSGGSTNNIQYYSLSIATLELPFIPLVLSVNPNNVPDGLDPGETASFPVTINTNDDTLVAGSADLFYRTSGSGSFQSVDLTGSAPNFTATLPAFLCADGSVEFYVQAQGTETGVVTFPINGAAAPFEALVGEIVVSFADNFQTNQGWTVSTTAADGGWTRGTPVNAGRGDPATDSDGSGQCYLTDNSAANGGNSDVDDGETTLTSPSFDFSAGGTISWDYWLNDFPGGLLNADFLRVQTSNNGGAWQTIAEYTTAASNWRSDSVTISAANASANFRVRFIAADLGTQNVVEAGVDNFRVQSLSCEDPAPSCVADFNNDGTVNILDVVDFITNWNSQGTGADFNNDGSINVLDVVAFITIWNVGCP